MVATERRPNIVLIMTDTQATNVVGCYGHPDLRTPHIDRLAQSGMRFERAYTTCPVCTPARAGLFTGIYPHTAGAWTNNLPLGTNIRTMGQRFEEGGYRTGYIGKWHLDGHDYFGTGICPPGWEPQSWYDGRNYLDELTDDEIRLWRCGLNTYADLVAHDIRPGFTWAHRVSDRAVRFLESQDDRPFLLVVSYDEPHHPFTCPPEYVEPFLKHDHLLGPAAGDTLEEKPAHQREWAAASNVSLRDGMVRSPMYFGCNSFVDAEIGRVIDAVHALAPHGTIIVFTSDHGEMLGAHRLTGKGAAMYDDISRIPLIVEGPEVGAGSVCPEAVSHIDLLPTFLQWAGLPIPPILEGESLAHLLHGEQEPDRCAFIEFNRYEIEHDSFGGFQPVRCVVDGRHKLVINLMTTDELYDLESDPAELRNRIEDPAYSEIRDALHDRLLAWMYEKRDPFRGYYWERRPWRDRRRLAWKGLFRPRPADGHAPPVREYDTGQPATGAKVEPGTTKRLG